MIREKMAQALLGLRAPYTRADIQRRFTELAKTGHADMGGLMDMAKLVEAKEILLANHTDETPCPLCHGVGYIKNRRCTQCKGGGAIVRS